MVTTIQLKENIKNALDRLKENERETYEDIIVKMMNQLEVQKRTNTNLMIEGAKETSEEGIRITKEFEKIEKDFDWKWS